MNLVDNLIFDNSNTSDQDNKLELSNKTNEDGLIVFGGGNSLTLSNNQFDQLKSIVMDLRTSIIEGN